MAKKKVFISFDFDNDQVVKEFVIQQARSPDSPFELSDHSLKEPKPDREWKARARTAIARSDVFIVMLGPYTRSASGVGTEVAIANELLAAGQIEKSFQLIGYSAGSRDWALPDAGSVYEWNWENLKKLLA
jgi:hypothetical protein